jgi:hypothetical protein
MIFKIGSLNQKQTFALAAIIIGTILILFAANGMHKAGEAKSSIDKFTDFFTNSTGMWNSVIEFFGGAAHKKASKYDTTLIILMTLGITMVVSGIWGLFYYKKRG